VGKRKSITDSTREMALLEAGYKCANPNCRHVLTLELHHIVWVREGGGNELENLLALCPNCHSLHTKGHIPSKAVLAWKSLLVSIGNPNRGAVDFLLVLEGEEKRVEADAGLDAPAPKFRFTGDSLPFLAPLLTSGLIEVSKRYIGASSGAAHPSFEVGLTERGRRLVYAWVEGSPEGVKNALDRSRAGRA
jgi:hypothetical protein